MATNYPIAFISGDTYVLDVEWTYDDDLYDFTDSVVVMTCRTDFDAAITFQIGSATGEIDLSGQTTITITIPSSLTLALNGPFVYDLVVTKDDFRKTIMDGPINIAKRVT
jgi:hypothetical protein